MFYNLFTIYAFNLKLCSTSCNLKGLLSTKLKCKFFFLENKNKSNPDLYVAFVSQFGQWSLSYLKNFSVCGKNKTLELWTQIISKTFLKLFPSICTTYMQS